MLLSLQDCQFTKKKDDTALRVVFQGNIYLGSCGGCCKRWFITFNGVECSGPLPIDVAIWIRNKDEDNHRPGAIEGYCDNASSKVLELILYAINVNVILLVLLTQYVLDHISVKGFCHVQESYLN